MIKDGNPLLGKISQANGTGTMTFGGTASKSLVLLGLLLTGALYTYEMGPAINMSSMWGAALGAFVIAMITIFNPKISPITGPIYALLEGSVLGIVSILADLSYPGIAMQAVLSTSGVFLVMILLYSNKTIRVNHKFISGITSALFGILIIYLADIILSFFGIRLPVVNEPSPLGVIFSLVVVGIASLSLAIDFHQIEEGISQGAPKFMEWYCSFSLMISLVWLYLEILRLLRKTKD